MRTKKYDLDKLADVFTVSDFTNEFKVNNSVATKTIKYWISRKYVTQIDENTFEKIKKSNVQTIKVESSIKQESNQSDSSSITKSEIKQSDLNDKTFEVKVAGTLINVVAKSVEDVIHIMTQRYGYPDSVIEKISEI